MQTVTTLLQISVHIYLSNSGRSIYIVQDCVFKCSPTTGFRFLFFCFDDISQGSLFDT